MKLRCPYCRTEFKQPAKGCLCPQCKRAMLLPPSLRKHSARERKRAKDRIRRNAERQKRQLLFSGGVAGRRSGGQLAFALIILLTAGALLVSRVTRPPSRPAGRSPIMIAERELGNLAEAVCLFKKDTGRYPTPEEGLLALINNPGIESWNGPYVNLIKPDPWRTHYQLRHKADGRVKVVSAGPDGTWDTEKDMKMIAECESPNPLPPEFSNPL